MATYELYTGQAEVIEAVLSHICGTRRLIRDSCEEFSAWVRLKLLEDDSAILRKFSARSSARTYLITVVQRLYLDWRNKEWGKWRPSAAARRTGQVAIELERLIIRDRLPFEEAAQHLIASGTVQSRDECAETWAALPQRPGRRHAGEGELDGAAAPSSPDQLIVDDQRRRAETAGAVLTDVLSALDAPDHLVVRLRFQDGFTVARIAQVTGQDQKALYRRIDSILARMRQAMLARGVSAADVIEVLGSNIVDFPASFAASAGKSGIGPSNERDAAGGS